MSLFINIEAFETIVLIHVAREPIRIGRPWTNAYI